MKAVLSLSRRATYADYVAAEQNSEGRHELIDGMIVGMAGSSDEHNAIRDGDSFELPGLTRAIAVNEVYDGLLDPSGRSLLR